MAEPGLKRLVEGQVSVHPGATRVQMLTVGNPVRAAQYYKMNINFQNIGWKSKITQKRTTLSISINKLVAIGSCLEKGQTLYCYLANDKNKRPVMVVYLDGKEKEV